MSTSESQNQSASESQELQQSPEQQSPEQQAAPKKTYNPYNMEAIKKFDDDLYGRKAR